MGHFTRASSAESSPGPPRKRGGMRPLVRRLTPLFPFPKAKPLPPSLWRRPRRRRGQLGKSLASVVVQMLVFVPTAAAAVTRAPAFNVAGMDCFVPRGPAVALPPAHKALPHGLSPFSLAAVGRSICTADATV